MEKYEVFKSEGGYRVCGAVWNNSPVMDKSPWYETKDGAESAAREIKFKDETRDYGVFRRGQTWIASLSGTFYNFETRATAVESVISAIERFGYSRDYILQKRNDLS